MTYSKMTADEMISLILPIAEYFKERAESNSDPVDAELSDHYRFTLQRIAEDLAEMQTV